MEIKVKAGSKKEKVEKKNGYYLVSVKAKAIEGKANLAVLKLLKKHFKREVRIIKGKMSKHKIVSFI